MLFLQHHVRGHYEWQETLVGCLLATKGAFKLFYPRISFGTVKYCIPGGEGVNMIHYSVKNRAINTEI